MNRSLSRAVRRPARRDAAQATAEYALVLAAVTVMLGVVIAYLEKTGGGVIADLFGSAFAHMRSVVGG